MRCMPMKRQRVCALFRVRWLPRTFVEFKHWMAEHAQNREPLKRRRDLRQANIVQELLTEGLLDSRMQVQTS